MKNKPRKPEFLRRYHGEFVGVKMKVEDLGELASVGMHPAVFRDDGDYGVRIVMSRRQNFSTGRTKETYDYYRIREDGVILRCPRGLSHLKGKIVTDLGKYFAEAKEGE